MTNKEAKLLSQIITSEYHDGMAVVGHPVWVDCVCDGLGASAGGVMASLVAKGWAQTDGEACWVTQAGLLAAHAAKATA